MGAGTDAAATATGAGGAAGGSGGTGSRSPPPSAEARLEAFGSAASAPASATAPEAAGSAEATGTGEGSGTTGRGAGRRLSRSAIEVNWLGATGRRFGRYCSASWRSRSGSFSSVHSVTRPRVWSRIASVSRTVRSILRSSTWAACLDW